MEQIQAQDRSPGQHQKVMGGGKRMGRDTNAGTQKSGTTPYGESLQPSRITLGGKNVHRVTHAVQIFEVHKRRKTEAKT